MGITNENVVFLSAARRAGVSFAKTLTIGRQILYADHKTLAALAREDKIDGSAATQARTQFSEEFFKRFLGAEEIVSLDNSTYEGADLTHDMNVPVPLDWEENYDAIVDAGSLEHVFNFPVALANCMRMVKTGGRLFFFTPANNLFGHGFYQFSPELFWSALSVDHGFAIERMVAVEFKYMGTEYGSFRQQYEVKDPRVTLSRVTLANSHPVMLLVQAKKIRHTSNPFQKQPQQSDYLRLWDCGAQSPTAGASGTEGPMSIARRFKSLLPRPVQGFLKRLLRLIPQSVRIRIRNKYGMYFEHSFRNGTYFRPFNRE